MAKKTIEKFYSDLSGEEIDGSNPTATFAVNGRNYEIDLTDAERESLSRALSPYIKAARQFGRRSTPPRDGPPASEIRAWAIEQGLEIPARGRIPLEILAAYDEAH